MYTAVAADGGHERGDAGKESATGEHRPVAEPPPLPHAPSLSILNPSPFENIGWGLGQVGMFNAFTDMSPFTRRGSMRTTYNSGGIWRRSTANTTTTGAGAIFEPRT